MSNYQTLSKLFSKMTPEEMEIARDIAKGTGRQGAEEVERASAMGAAKDAEEASLKDIPDETKDLVQTAKQHLDEEKASGKLPAVVDKSDVKIPEVMDEAADSSKMPVKMEQADTIPAEGRTISDVPQLDAPEQPKMSSTDPTLDQSFLDKYSKYKKGLGIAAGAGAIGAGLMMDDGKGTPVPKTAPPQAPIPSAQPSIASKKEDDDSDDEDEDDTTPAKNNSKGGAQGPADSSGKKLLDVDFGQGANPYSTDQLAQVQRERDQMAYMNQLAKSANLFGASLARTAPVGQELFDDNIKLADRGVQNFMQKAEFAKQDPNSPVSQGYKQLLTKMGYNIKGNASAADIEKLFPSLTKIYDAEESRIAREHMSRENAKDRAIKLKTLQSFQEDKLNNSDNAKMQNALNYNKTARSNSAVISNTITFGNKIEKLLDQVPINPDGTRNYNAITPAQKTEVLGAYDQMIKGRATVSGQHELIKGTDTIFGEAARLKQWLSGSPAKGNEGPIMEQLANTIKREGGLAQEQLKDLDYQVASGYQRLKKSDPDKYNTVLQATQSPLDELDQQIRQKGYRAYQISRLTDMGYSKDEINDFAQHKVNPDTIRPKLNTSQTRSNHSKPSSIPNLLDQHAALIPTHKVRPLSSYTDEEIANMSSDEIDEINRNHPK